MATTLPTSLTATTFVLRAASAGAVNSEGLLGHCHDCQVDDVERPAPRHDTKASVGIGCRGRHPNFREPLQNAVVLPEVSVRISRWCRGESGRASSGRAPAGKHNLASPVDDHLPGHLQVQQEAAQLEVSCASIEQHRLVSPELGHGEQDCRVFKRLQAVTSVGNLQ